MIRKRGLAIAALVMTLAGCTRQVTGGGAPAASSKSTTSTTASPSSYASSPSSTAPRLRTSTPFTPQVLAFDPTGRLYISDCDEDVVFRLGASGKLTVVAGNLTPGYSGDGGRATNAQLYCPLGLAFDAKDDLYVTDDHGTDRVRMIDPRGIISTIAGSGTPELDAGGYSGDGGPAIRAHLQMPVGIATDIHGNLYISDRDNSVIRKVTADGTITTIAGTGQAGYSGDGGAATAAELDGPIGIVVDAQGNVYIADSNNGRVRKIDTGGIITTIAGIGQTGSTSEGGPGPETALADPEWLALDAASNLYISETGGNRVWKIDASGTAAPIAAVEDPGGLVVDASGNLYVADRGSACIRYVDPAGMITTVVCSK
jgi:sugar lactone lactonase YvrE